MKTLLAFLMILSLAACASVKTTTTTTLDANGRPTSVVQTVSGPVEGMAAVQHAAVAKEVVKALPQLTHKITLERGYDKEGNKLEPYTLTLVDSAAYAVAKMAMNFSGYESPEVKALRTTMKLLSRVTPWALAWLMVDSVSNSAGTHNYNFADSFNNNKQSPVSMFNGHGSAQHLNLTNNEDNSQKDDHSNHDDHSTPADSD